MKISVLQAETLLGQPEKNRNRLETLLKEAVAEHADVVVFPETWNVGFFPENIEEIAEDVETSASLKWMKEWARQHQINVVGGSIAVREADKLYNRAYVINRQGEIVYSYNKIHLFSPGKEPQYFTAGDQAQTFTLDGITCGIMICYDLRFPELARMQAVEGAQILFIPAQWPHPRSNHWVSLSKARAIENQMYVVTINGCGQAGDLQSCGHSAIFDPWGEEVFLAGETEGIFHHSIHTDIVEQVRTKIPVFKDRKPVLYKL